MHRFYIPPRTWNADRLTLDSAEAHHALDVLRLEIGSRVTVFNGQGSEALADITGATRDSVTLRTVQVSKTAPLGCAITLAQAVPKAKNMEWIIEKATELGASAIVPLLSERTVVQVDADDAGRKRQKWERTVVEAAKQCGQNWVPTVETPQSPRDFFAQKHSFDLMLVASLQPDARHLKKVLLDLGTTSPRSVLVLVGPEGDFTPAEMSQAKSHGCQPITLGPIILRTETAAMYCLSVLGHELFGGG